MYLILPLLFFYGLCVENVFISLTAGPYYIQGFLIVSYHINPLTAGAAYIRIFHFYYHIKYHLLNMLEIKCEINQQYLNISILSNPNNFHSLEVVDRVSDAQLQVSENSD